MPRALSTCALVMSVTLFLNITFILELFGSKSAADVFASDIVPLLSMYASL